MSSLTKKYECYALNTEKWYDFFSHSKSPKILKAYINSVIKIEYKNKMVHSRKVPSCVCLLVSL